MFFWAVSRKAYHKITRQLNPLTLVLEIAALQQKVCNSTVLDQPRTFKIISSGLQYNTRHHFSPNSQMEQRS
ncbi:hypothetical protein WJX79_004168 [Trebouxia sp. C0005]